MFLVTEQLQFMKDVCFNQTDKIKSSQNTNSLGADCTLQPSWTLRCIITLGKQRSLPLLQDGAISNGHAYRVLGVLENNTVERRRVVRRCKEQYYSFDSVPTLSV